MEVIGDPQVFAVQLDWDRRPTCKPWRYGVFCVHICGERLGSSWNQATLNSILAELDGWKPTALLRHASALMAADSVTAFLSIEEETYGLEHLEGELPPGFAAVPVPGLSAFEILGVDGLDDYRIYCVEDDATSRLLYARIGELPRECRAPQPQTLRVSTTRRAGRCHGTHGRTARRLVRAVAALEGAILDDAPAAPPGTGSRPS